MLRKYLWPFIISSIVIFLFLLIPYGVFYINFREVPYSSETEHWGHFGDFTGNTANILIGFFNLLALIFLTLKLIEVDDERNEKNIRPLGQISTFINYEKPMQINLENNGFGPMVIEKISISNGDNVYDNYYDLCCYNNNISFFKPYVKSNQMMPNKSSIKPGDSICLLELKLDSNSNVGLNELDRREAYNVIKKELESYNLKIIYKDMFGNNLTSIEG